MKIPALVSLYRADPVLLTYISAHCSEGIPMSGHITALHQTAALWNVGADGLVLVIAFNIYFVGS